MNTIGTKIRFTDFGESHGSCVGGVIDGMPAGFSIDVEQISRALARRRGDTLPPMLQIGISQRATMEEDNVEWLSGLHEGTTTGTPIAFIVHNNQQRKEDYNDLADVYRPGHADYTYQQKYGIREVAGGGRASARETAARVVAGNVILQWLNSKGITINAHIKQIGSAANLQAAHDLLRTLNEKGDSIGGIVSCSIKGVKAGMGEPVFNKLPAELAAAMLSINGCKGFDYGSGFEGISKTGSQLNDQMPYHTNNAGGCLGGISNGQEIYFRCVFKPTSSIAMPQQTITTEGEIVQIKIKGRHDTCFALRTPVIVESMAAIAIAQFVE